MHVMRTDEVAAEEVQSALFTGGRVTRQPLVTSEISNNFTLGMVNFSPGARNLFHTHTSDQVLLVTGGTGIVATKSEQQVVTEGAVIHIPAGEMHWHGATEDSAFSHISLTAMGSRTDY